MNAPNLKQYLRISFILIITFIINTQVFAQSKTMEFTTNSEEALQLFIEGRDLQENSANEIALERFEKALTLDPEFLMVHLYMGILKADPSYFEEYKIKCNNGELDVSEGEKLFIDWVENYIVKNVTMMKDAMSKLILLYSDDPRIQFYNGLAHYYSNEIGIAKNYFDNALKLDENMAIAYNMLGYSYLNLGDAENAEKNFKMYIKYRSEMPNPYDSYAEFLLREGRYSEAKQNFEKSLTLRPAFWNSLNLLGNIYLIEKDYVQAKNYFEKVTTLEETTQKIFDAKFMVAITDILAGNIESALTQYEKIAIESGERRLWRFQAQAYAYKGFVLSEMGEKEKGFEYLSKAVELIDDKNIYDLRVNGSVWKIYHLSNAGNIKDAKIELDNMQDIVFSARSLDAYNLWFSCEGYLNFLAKDFEKATKSFMKGAENALNWYLLGKSLQEKGDIENAKLYFKKIVDNKAFDVFQAVYLSKAEKELASI